MTKSAPAFNSANLNQQSTASLFLQTLSEAQASRHSDVGFALPLCGSGLFLVLVRSYEAAVNWVGEDMLIIS